MIKKQFLKKQLDKARRERHTTPFFKRLVFRSVDSALRARYRADYPTKCLQSSVGIKVALDSLGIDSTIVAGSVCFTEVFEGDDSRIGWGGFWDKDHHVWLSTEFREFVDLTISELHLHPTSSRSDALPVLPVWWEDIEEWPPIIRYLPKAPVDIQLCNEDMVDLKEFQNDVRSVLGKTFKESSVEDVSFGPILEGMSSLNRLTSEGNLWLRKSLLVQKLNIQFPEWIRVREMDLKNKYGGNCT